MAQKCNWQELKKLPGPLVRSEKEYQQLIEAVRLASIVPHLEILKQSFYEYRKTLKKEITSLEELGYFLLDLRNAFSHTENELLPRFLTKVRTKKSIEMHIPVTKLENNYLMFDKASSSCILYKIDVYPGKIISINDQFINNIYYLSMHILTITKKQKLNTLETYLTKNSHSKVISNSLFITYLV